MDPKDKNLPRPIKKSLSSRILIRLIFPLFILAVVFTALQLTNQIYNMNNLSKIQSQLIFQTLNQRLQEIEQKNSEGFAFEKELEKTITDLTQNYNFGEIVIYNWLDKKLLFDKDIALWSPLDQQAVEEALYFKQQGKPYHTKISREKQWIIAYIPFHDQTSSQLLIARAMVPLANLQNALKKSRTSLIMMLSFILLTGIVIGRSLAKLILNPVRKLNEASKLIMQGKLGKHVEIHTGDEMEMLARTFNHMSDRFVEIKQEAEDANPLTQLPGNQAIFHELQKRIHERQKFVLFHIDLDRFKVFNDHFGLARGDDAIKKTADLLRQAVKEKGAFDDFVGHQGGDDFIIMTRPNHAEKIARFVCERFEKEIVSALYRKSDLEKGYIEQIDRRRQAETGETVMTKFPFLAISLAGVSSLKKDYADYFDCMSQAAAVKTEVKKVIQSSFLIKE